MRRSGDASWEMWAILIGIILMVALPVVTGILIFRAFRSYRPLEEPEEVSLANLGECNEDGFFKKYVVGWLVCGPIFYLVYNFVLSE